MAEIGIIVLHGEFDPVTFEMTGHIPVAAFTFEADNIADACECAWRATQNLTGSWSRCSDGDGDHSLILLKPLRIINGQEYGHRSSMVGDRFLVTQAGNLPQMYEAKSFGFIKVK